MASPPSSRALFAGLVLGFGLDFCVREYLLPWYRKRLAQSQSSAQPERHDEDQSSDLSVRLGSPTVPWQPRFPRSDRYNITEDEFANGSVLSSTPSQKVLRIGTSVAIKFGLKVDLAEAETMTFIRENTTIPVPEILDAYSRDGKNYIVMEYIQGVLLSDVWDDLSTNDKSTITRELKDYIRQMRELSAPEDVLIGSVVGGPAVDRRQLAAVTGGPFPSEKEFNDWQVAQLYSGIPLSQQEMYAAVHKSNHRIVFTHGDLVFHNVIINEGHIKAIIDWEYSGWYPEYRDYCKTMSFIGGTEEGYLVCKEIYEKPYHDEYFLDTWFSREIIHGGF